MGKVFFHLGPQYCPKGTSIIEFNDKLLKDDGKGNLLEGETKLGRINYKTGIVTITPKSTYNYFSSTDTNKSKKEDKKARV